METAWSAAGFTRESILHSMSVRREKSNLMLSINKRVGARMA